MFNFGFNPLNLVVDPGKLPGLTRDIMFNFLKPLHPNVSDSCLLNMINVRLAQVVTYKRLYIQPTKNEKPSIVNLYAINIMDSGSHKDKVLNDFFKYLLPGFIGRINMAKDDYIKEKKTSLRKIAEEKYPNKIARQETFMNKVEIRDIKTEIRDGTPEGLMADLLAIQDFKLGSAFIRIPELGLYLDNPNQSQQHFINALIELYEGSTSGKTTKSDKKESDIIDIPINCILYSDPTKLISEKGSDSLKSLFETGLGRRTFLSYNPTKPLFFEEDYLVYTKIRDNAYDSSYPLQGKINCIYDNLNKFDQGLDGKKEDKLIFYLSKEGDELLHAYMKHLTDRYNGKLEKEEGVVCKEVLNRYWKVLKLAAIIAACEHPTYHIVTPQDLQYAIYQAELLGLDFELFTKARPRGDTDKLINYFLENINKPINTKTIRDQLFVNKSKFANWWKENLPLLQEWASDNYYELKQEKFHRNTGTKYTLVKKEKPTYSCKLYEFNISIAPKEIKREASKHTQGIHYGVIKTDPNQQCSEPPEYYTNPYGVKNNVVRTLTLETLAGIIEMGKHYYSSFKFVDGYRSIKHQVGDIETIILDFDHNCSLREIKNVFKNCLSLIHTTKSHKKEKNGEVGDRFRLILPIAPINAETYKSVISNIIDHFGADKSCKDLARTWETNSNAEIFMFNGELFDPLIFVSKEKEILEEEEMTLEEFKGELAGINLEDLTEEQRDCMYEKAGFVFDEHDKNTNVYKGACFVWKMCKNGEISEDEAVQEIERIGAVLACDPRTKTQDSGQAQLQRIIRRSKDKKFYENE